MTNEKDFNIILCNWCGQQARIVWVHSHGQCAHCGYNIDECCRGEQCSQENISDKNENNDHKG